MKNKLIKYTSKIAFLTILIAGYQLPNHGLQNIAIAFVWLILFISIIVLLVVTSSTTKERAERSPIIRRTTKTQITINIAASIYLIYNDAIATGIAFMLATLFVYMVSDIIMDKKEET